MSVSGNSELASILRAPSPTSAKRKDSKPWAVIKYGGTSVSSAACWKNVVLRCKELASSHRVCIVASAVSQVTNLLGKSVEQALANKPLDGLETIIGLHEKLAGEIGIALDSTAYAPVAQLLGDLRKLLEGIRLTEEASPRVMARVSAFGELASTHLGVAALKHLGGLDCLRVDARQVLTSTPTRGEEENDRYLNAKVTPFTEPAKLEAECGTAALVITQGFIARTPAGETCLLGRGGSDTSASLFAGVVKADFLEIWTDVHGLYTCDPRIIPEARLIRRINYREAQELAAMGAKVLHPKCLRPAEVAGVPVEIRMTSDPETPGTTICDQVEEDPAVMAVVHRMGVTLMTLSTLQMWQEAGFLQRAFSPFKDLGMSIDLVATSQSTVSITLDHIPGGVEGKAFKELTAMLTEMAGPSGSLQVQHNMSTVSIVGRHLRRLLATIGHGFAELPQDLDVALVSESSEDLNFSLVVTEPDAVPLVKLLHRELIALQGNQNLFGSSWTILKAAIEARGNVDAKHMRGAGGDRSPRLGPLDEHEAWWKQRPGDLVPLLGDEHTMYVYHTATIEARVKQLQLSCAGVDTLSFPISRCSNTEVLKTLIKDEVALECSSAKEIDAVTAASKANGTTANVIFAPNFSGPSEYARAVELGAELVVNCVESFEESPKIFKNKDVTLQVDPSGTPTGRAMRRFGHPMAEVNLLFNAAKAAGANVTGLQVRCSRGPTAKETCFWFKEALASALEICKGVQFVDVEVNLVCADGATGLDMLQKEIEEFCKWAATKSITVRMQQGTFVLNTAVVMLTKVAQVRESGGIRYICTSSGLQDEDLFAASGRPVVVRARHRSAGAEAGGRPRKRDIINISHQARCSRRESSDGIDTYAHVVCPGSSSSGVDFISKDQRLPRTQRDDILLVANTWASGQILLSSSQASLPETVLPVDGAGESPKKRRKM